MVALCVASTTKVVVKVPARDAAAPAAARAPAFAPRAFLEKVRADPRVTDVAFRPRVQPNILFRKRIAFVLPSPFPPTLFIAVLSNPPTNKSPRVLNRDSTAYNLVNTTTPKSRTLDPEPYALYP